MHVFHMQAEYCKSTSFVRRPVYAHNVLWCYFPSSFNYCNCQIPRYMPQRLPIWKLLRIFPPIPLSNFSSDKLVVKGIAWGGGCSRWSPNLNWIRAPTQLTPRIHNYGERRRGMLMEMCLRVSSIHCSPGKELVFRSTTTTTTSPSPSFPTRLVLIIDGGVDVTARRVFEVVK